MVRRSRAQAAETQQAPAAAPDEPQKDVAATEQDDARDLDFERYVSDLAASREAGAGRPTMFLRADVVAARAAAEQDED